jgi:hypothetical protein
MVLKDIYELENCASICHQTKCESQKRKLTCKIENYEKWSVSNGVYINQGAKRAKCKIENCDNKRKNNGLFRKNGAVKYICEAES